MICGEVTMFQIHWKKICWFRAVLVLLASILILLGMISCEGFVHFNGVVYRKRVAVFILTVLASVALAAWKIPESKRWKYSRPVYVILGIAAGALAFQSITSCDHKTLLFIPTGFYLPLTVAISAILYMIIWMILWDSRRAVVAYYWLMCLLGYGYQCVYEFRGIHFKLTDLLTLGTALAVADNYQYTVDASLMFACIFGVLLWVLAGSVKKQKTQTRAAKWNKPIALLLTAGWVALLLCTDILAQWKVNTTAFDQNTYKLTRIQGTITTLIRECQQLIHIRPADYEPSALPEKNERLMQGGTCTDNQVRPNIFVVMNESMADLGARLEINLNATP